MKSKIIASGFGGQGVVMVGNVIAFAAFEEGKHTTFMVSYGAEMRGGTAHSITIVSDEEIASPIVTNPNIAIIMNRPSLDKFEPLMEKDSLLIINTSLVDRKVERKDLNVIEIKATDIANELGNPMVANMVALGALMKKTNMFKPETVIKAMKEVLTESKKAFFEINEKAIMRGMQEVK